MNEPDRLIRLRKYKNARKAYRESHQMHIGWPFYRFNPYFAATKT